MTMVSFTAGRGAAFMRGWGRLNAVPAAQPLPFDSYCLSPVPLRIDNLDAIHILGDDS
jgi:hypothetical protein